MARFPWGDNLALDKGWHGRRVGASQSVLLPHHTTSRFGQAQVHYPATAYMHSRTTQMAENVRVRTTRLIKSIRKDRPQSIIQCTLRHDPLVLVCLCESDNHAVIPGKDGEQA
jgi:hypothetical protein